MRRGQARRSVCSPLFSFASEPTPGQRWLAVAAEATTRPPPRGCASQVAKRIKEKYCYVCPDMAKEFRKYDDDPRKWVKQYEGTFRGQAWDCDVAYERFLGPECAQPPVALTPCDPNPLWP